MWRTKAGMGATGSAPGPGPTPTPPTRPKSPCQWATALAPGSRCPNSCPPRLYKPLPSTPLHLPRTATVNARSAWQCMGGGRGPGLHHTARTHATLLPPPRSRCSARRPGAPCCHNPPFPPRAAASPLVPAGSYCLPHRDPGACRLLNCLSPPSTEGTRWLVQPAPHAVALAARLGLTLLSAAPYASPDPQP